MALAFMKKGAAAHKAIDNAEAQAEAKKEAQKNDVRRHWMPQNSERQLTFIDGDLSDEGLLETVSFWEHQLKIAGDWKNWFPCTQVVEPCPICDGGDSQPYLVTLFTVIDHSSYTDRNGKVWANQRRLFACKKETFRRLQKIAAKRGGLAGLTLDVSRGGDKSASCGDTFEFVEKHSLKDLQKKYKLPAEDIVPIDYEKVITYRTAKELQKFGFGVQDGGHSSHGGGKVLGSGDADSVEGADGAYDDEV